MIKMQADYIFPINRPPVKNGIVVLTEDGYIQEVANEGDFPDEEITRYRGVLCPGFINAHCHLELSHLKGAIPAGTGLLGFLKPIGELRKSFDEVDILKEIEAGEKEMIKNGIVAVGDISNTPHTIERKRQGNLDYHTFLEIFGLNPARADLSIGLGKELFAGFAPSNGNICSIVPHAPYSVSGNLLRQIEAFSAVHGGGVVSIHNQECLEEEELFRFGTGEFVEFYHTIGMGKITDFFTPPGTSSLYYVLSHLEGNCKLLLIHNTYTSAEDIAFAHASYHNDIYWCFCPNANLYIENRLPDFEQFMRNRCQIVIGTDSLTSNRQLCILSELKTIALNAPQIPLSELLTWATLNGATALGFEKTLGSFETGKKPGVVLIENLNTETLELQEHSTARRVG